MSSHRTASSTRSLLIIAIIIYWSLVGGHSETPRKRRLAGLNSPGAFGRLYCAVFGQTMRSSEQYSSISRMSWRI